MRISAEIVSRKHEGRPTDGISGSGSVARVPVLELTEPLGARRFVHVTHLVLTCLLSSSPRPRLYPKKPSLHDVEGLGSTSHTWSMASLSFQPRPQGPSGSPGPGAHQQGAVLRQSLQHWPPPARAGLEQEMAREDPVALFYKK